MHEVMVNFSHICGVYGIVLISIIGFIFIDRKIFGYCIYLMMLTMVYNTVLKNIFQIPLPSTCPVPGFGFPSGHMHFASVFYLWLFLHYKHWVIRVFCISMLMCYAYTIVYLGFHYVYEVCAGCAFALVSVLLYKHLIKSIRDFHRISLFTITLTVLFATESKTVLIPSTAMITIALLLIGYTVLTWFVFFKKDEMSRNVSLLINFMYILVIIHALIFRNSIIHLPSHIYIALYFMTGLYVGWCVLGESKDPGILGKTSALLATVCIYYLLKYVFNLLNIDTLCIKQIMWFWFACLIPVSVKLSGRYLQKR